MGSITQIQSFEDLGALIMDIFGNIIDRFSFKKIYIMVKGGINKLKQFNNRFSAVFDTSAEVC
jgi:hypothetical protein